MANIIDGKLVTAEVRKKTAAEIAEFKEKSGVTPGLAVILVGDDPASAVYVRNKHKGCVEVGINSYEIKMPAETTEEDLLSEIARLNADSNVHGILVQLPLPKHISEERVLNSISPKKDVDAFHPENVGKIMLGKYAFLPCTPAGIMELLYENGCLQKCGNALVIGRSELVGRPIAEMLIQENQTVTIAHSKTPRDVLLDAFARADLVVSAAGQRNLITEEDAYNYFKDNRHYPVADFTFKKNRVIVDVSINRDENGKLCGDFSEEFKDKYSEYYTPVPGGVGPMTVAMLMFNTYMAARDRDYYEGLSKKKKELTE